MPPIEQMVYTDVSQAEGPGRGNAEALSAAFELSSGAIALVDRGQRILRANRAFADLIGYERERLCGVALSRVCALDERRPVMLASAEVDLKRRDGSTLRAQARLTPVRSGADGPAFVLTIEQLPESSELRAIRARCSLLEEYVAIARGFVDQAGDALVVHNADRTIRYWSSSAQRMFGIPAEDAKGKTYAQLLGPDAALPDDEYQAMFLDGSWRGELRCVLPSGRIMLVERHCQVVRHGDSMSVFTMNVDAGERYRAERESALLKNLLEQRIKKQTAQLRETAEDLRDLSYSIAHDLRAPLTSIEGFSAQLEKRLASMALDDTSRHYLDRVRAGVAALGNMTNALIALAAVGRAKLSPQPVDMSALARRVCARLRAAEAPRELEVAIAETAVPIGDLALIKGLLEHLFSNALKFTANTAGARIVFDCEISEQGVCVFRLADNGAGFDPAYAYKLFTPFQRLHSQEEFPGTGMGLALARKIVARHGGRIWAESAPGTGTTVFFTFHDVSGGDMTPDRVRIAEDASRWERFRAAD